MNKVEFPIVNPEMDLSDITLSSKYLTRAQKCDLILPDIDDSEIKTMLICLGGRNRSPGLALASRIFPDSERSIFLLNGAKGFLSNNSKIIGKSASNPEPCKRTFEQLNMSYEEYLQKLSRLAINQVYLVVRRHEVNNKLQDLRRFLPLVINNANIQLLPEKKQISETLRIPQEVIIANFSSELD